MARRFRRRFYASREQLVYAAVLDLGMKIGMGALVVTFVIYISGVLPAHIPPEELPNYWGLSLGEYMTVAGVEAGWGWLKLAGTGDFINFFGVCFLAAVTIFSYVRIVIYPLKKKDKIFATLLIVQILVLALGASGILAMGH